MNYGDQIHRINVILDKIGWGKYTTFVFFSCSSAWFMVNFVSLSISFIMRAAKKMWNIEDYMVGIIETSYMFGVFLGSFLFGYVSDQYGRILAFRISGLISLTGAFFLCFSINYSMVILFGFIHGFGAGGEITISGPVFLEICPNKNR